MIVKDQLILKKNAIRNHVILKRKNAKIIIHFVLTGSKFKLFTPFLSEKRMF